MKAAPAEPRGDVVLACPNCAFGSRTYRALGRGGVCGLCKGTKTIARAAPIAAALGRPFIKRDAGAVGVGVGAGDAMGDTNGNGHGHEHRSAQPVDTSMSDALLAEMRAEVEAAIEQRRQKAERARQRTLAMERAVTRAEMREADKVRRAALKEERAIVRARLAHRLDVRQKRIVRTDVTDRAWPPPGETLWKRSRRTTFVYNGITFIHDGLPSLKHCVHPRQADTACGFSVEGWLLDARTSPVDCKPCKKNLEGPLGPIDPKKPLRIGPLVVVAWIDKDQYEWQCIECDARCRHRVYDVSRRHLRQPGKECSACNRIARKQITAARQQAAADDLARKRAARRAASDPTRRTWFSLSVQERAQARAALDAGMTLADVARMIGVTDSAISARLKNGTL